MKMCRNCVRFPEDGNIANHVRTRFFDDTKKTTNVTCILEMSGIGFYVFNPLLFSIVSMVTGWIIDGMVD